MEVNDIRHKNSSGNLFDLNLQGRKSSNLSNAKTFDLKSSVER